VQNRVAALDAVMQRYNVVLESTRLLYRFSERPERSDLVGVFAQFRDSYPGLMALEWAPLVTQAERAGVEAAVRAEGFPGFVLKDLVDPERAEFQPAAEHAQYLPIIHCEPLAANLPALGFNLLTGRTVPEIAVARATDRTIMTHRLRLFSPESNVQGFIVYLPVREKAGPAGAAGRFRGIVAGVFRLDRLLADFAHDTRDGRGVLDMLIVDDSVRNGGEVLGLVGQDGRIQVDDPPAEKAFVASHTVWAPFPVWGRNWELLFRPTPQWLAASRSAEPVKALGLGLLATGALALFVYGRVRRSLVIESQVAERTAELRQTQKLLEEDIQQRIAAEQALKASEGRLQGILDHSPSAIFVKDVAGRYVLVNRQLARMWQRSPDEFIGQDDAKLFAPEIATSFRDGDQRMLATNTPIQYELTVHLPGAAGATTAIVQKFPLRDAEGRVYGLCGISTDITARKQAEAELQENRRQLSNLISQLPGAAFRCRFDEKLTMLFASEGLLALTGYPAEDYVAGRMHLPQLTVPDDRPIIRRGVAQAITDRRPFEIEYRLTHRNGQEKWVLVRGRPIYDETGGLRFLEGLAIDVTALKHAEQQKLAIERKLLAAQKLESLGVLAGGIAHDFNNILTSVLANASLARHDAGAGRPVDRSLEQIEHAARRAADLCQQMLAYAGKGKIVTDRVSLSELVRGTAALLEVTISKSTRLDLRLAPGLPPVLADVTQLRQIVMNLVINASDAIMSQTGLITVTTFTREADAALLHSALGNPDLPPGTYAGLEVTDNGNGMAPETIARIFEPFFTTKFSGRGLGLSAVLGIVQSHRGALFVESQLGRGSTFRLLLPATTGPTVSSAPPFSTPDERVRLHGTALVVDDEEAVRSIATTVLEIHGATIFPAASGEAALELLRANQEKISLVLLDMTMPGLSGEDTLRRMRMLGARQPVILMSGYSESEAMQRSANLGVAGFMQKPFEVDTLLAKVKPFLT
jgi:PAS domain S-box-containing protein